jgi:myosin heavy subunit
MGFAYRYTFEDFSDRYKILGPTKAASKKESGVQLIQYIPKHFPTSQEQWQQGLTKVFFKTELA